MVPARSVVMLVLNFFFFLVFFIDELLDLVLNEFVLIRTVLATHSKVALFQ